MALPILAEDPAFALAGAASSTSLLHLARPIPKRSFMKFKSGKDGANPVDALVGDNAGGLYGTTQAGGTSAACSGGCGTAFKLTPSGAKKYTEKILYSFAGGTGDGAHPRSALLAGKQGAFYGTTSFAGSASHGTIFVITPSGQSYSERVLYAFKGGYNDGSTPRGGMVMDKKQAIYGTTSNGGGSSSLGTVFKLAPADRPTRKPYCTNLSAVRPTEHRRTRM